jgi:SNF2 family DNA or RNA helicase
MYLDFTPDGSEFLIKYTPREADFLGLVGGLRRSKDCFVSEKSLAIAYQLRALFGDTMDSSQEVKEWGINEKAKYDLEPINTIPGQLFAHQERGAQRLKQVGTGLLGFQPGCGKSLTVLRTFEKLGAESFPALIVCPATLKRTWRGECDRWYPDLDVVVVEGSAAVRKKLLLPVDGKYADVYIINYEALQNLSHVGRYGSLGVEKKHSELNKIPFKTLVLDECQRIINAKAKSTRCIKELSRGSSVKYRWALSGTPIRNNPSDFWSLMNFFEPGVWTGKSKFLDMFCELKYNMWGGTEVVGIKKDRWDLFNKIVGLYLDFVSKEDVLPDLPEKTYSTRYIEMKPKQAKQYRQMLEDMLIKTDDGEYIIATSPLTAMSRLSQAACATLDVVDDVVEMDTPSCKVDALCELAGEMGGEPFVGFATSKKLINLCADKLRKEGYKVVLITGDQSGEEREHNIKAFQEGRAQIILGTSAMSEGVTLTAASTLVFIQLPYSNVLYSQVGDRIHRIGAVGDRVSIIHLVSEGTIEEKIMSALDIKDEHLSNLLGSKKEMGRWLTS